MNFFGVWQNIENFTVGDSLLVALIAMVLVFFVLVCIICITWIFQKGMDKIDAKTNILPKESNKILAEDEDAVAAVLVASIDFFKETGKEPEVISVTRIED